MNRREHLLTISMEECAEVSQRISKALRFGLEEIQPGQTLTNRQRIKYELCDLVGVLSMVDGDLSQVDYDAINEKRRKVEHFLKYSTECGTVAAKPCGCPDDGTVCLHGIPAIIGTDPEFPLTHRADYLGIDRSQIVLKPQK